MRDELERRSFLKATGGAAGALALAGCIGDDPSDGDDEDGSDEGVLNLVNSTMTSLDPIQSTDTASGRVIRQIFETLTHFPNGTTDLENLLVEGYELSDDGLTYTFELKEGVEFHNGEELTAQDFVYSFRRLAESPNSERGNFIIGDASFLNVEADIDENGRAEPESLGVEAVDDHTLEITLETQAPDALEILAYDSFAAVPEGLVGDIEGYDGEIDQSEFSSENPIGTGPFEFENWESDSEAEVVRYDDYHGSVANVDGVHWAIFEDDEARYTYAIEGNADIFEIPTAQYDASLIDAETDERGREVGSYGPMENDETVGYVGAPQLSTYYFAFNVPSVPRPVRQAIAYVVDHETLIQTLFEGRGDEAFTFTPSGMWPGGADAYESFIEDYPYNRNTADRDAAREVLEEAGYTEDDPYELTLTTYQSDVFQEAGREIRDQLSGLGVDLNLEEAPFATLQERGENGNLEFYSLGWTWSWPDPGYGMFGFEPENTDTSRMPGDTNGYYLDWHEADSDAAQQAQDAWERIEANPDPEDEDLRNEAYVEMEEAIWDDMVCIPLYHQLMEQFYYDRVDVEPFGAMGEYLQVFNEATLDQ
ncbi:ABC transporter substrate-binding protein [Natronobacterium texcoconense]|uniref:Peptide/nickel transport system substrate-binding protein n=1 Tax=Natronobacterium texcoconense TaxID=1095778 RepID=A0A1H1HRP5_NATTX|nr:ABC transporter substrate-binding protein [Natronobacterium texcoconense]SDR28175.1 peptide/nickel transport system substrate-binding protein [Natronobacterium texcoconense]